MIFLCGRRASGKTTLGKKLEQKGFWFFDTGPYWRKIRDQEHPNIDVEEFFILKRKETGVMDWEDEVLSKTLIENYNSKYFSKKDIVISGYRSLDELNYLVNKVHKKLFPLLPVHVWYIDCPFELSLNRFLEREDRSVTGNDLLIQYKYEDVKGIVDIYTNANWIIDNSLDIKNLDLQVSAIADIWKLAGDIR